MGYFPNGTAGMCYEEQYCWNCVHWNEGACPVMDAHNFYNYDQHDDNERGKALKVVLDLLIPETKDGLGNEQCSMFRAVADPEAEWAEQRRLATQPEKYAAAMADTHARPAIDGVWPNCSFWDYPCTLAAQGTEAGTATTPQSGVVHDGPVGVADAPTPDPLSNNHPNKGEE